MIPKRTVTVSPTLKQMAQIYSLSRSGGRGSPRFAAYLANVEHHWGLAAFNPMAGDAAMVAVNTLIALDAESVAGECAQQAADLCEWKDPVTLAVVAATPGMWTDRLATEVQHRTVADRRPAHGEILLWATDEQRVETITTEAAAEAVRTMWTAVHGAARSLHAIVAREGLAYATVHEAAPAQPVDARVLEAIEILGDTSTVGDIVALLYGDEAAVALGHTPLGIADRVGYELAISRARDLVARIGMPRALRSDWRNSQRSE